MRRRDFIKVIGGAAAGYPLSARAQQPGRLRLIGVLDGLSESDPEGPPRVMAFQRELENLGWTEGRNIRIEYRWAGGDADRIRTFAAELAGMKPDVVVARSTPAAEALARETHTIPIVFALVSDPIGSGLVASFARPGRNATGFTNFESSMGAKWIEILKEILPRIRRVALLFNPETAPSRGSIYLQPVQAAASSSAVDPIIAAVRSVAEVEDVLAPLARNADSGLIIMPDLFTSANRELIVATAARHRLPAVYSYRYFAAIGGLISYGIDVSDVFRRAAVYVDKILRGATPGDLPVQHPSKFEFVINLKTAKALGLTVPRVLLAGADEVIE
jgi:putative tryptophan/tyrosine transport system substrate-binding protein